MAKEIENIQEKMNWHWRNSMRPGRFFGVDARAALPFPVLIMYLRWSTVIMTLAFVMFFRFLEKRGLTFPAAIRNMRAWIVGRDRPGWVSVQKKRFIDYG